MASQATYLLGSTESEHRRLMIQARFLRPWTDRFLRAGGLAPGMSVLDLGSGMGDVSLLTAEIVGPEGTVTGIDRDETIAAKARRRFQNEALSDNVTAVVADLADYRPDGPVDAVIGRYVLLHLDDPAAVLRRYARFLRPGGLLIFHDIDSEDGHPSWPPLPEWDDCRRMFSRALRAGGAIADFGRRLGSTFLAAGLPRPVIEAVTPVASTPHSPILDWAARTMGSLESFITNDGMAPTVSLDYDDLVTRWRAAIEDGAQLAAPVQYGAWTRLP